MKIKILHISPNFNYSCGVSNYIYLLLKNIHESDQLEFHFITNGGDSLDRLDQLNIKYRIIKFTTGIRNIFYVITTFFNIRKYCIKHKINIIHTHHRFPELISYFISKTLKIKTITTVHSYVINNRLISFKSDKIIAVSSFIKNTLLNHFNIAEKRITVLYNFVEPLKPFNTERIKQLRNKYNLTSNDVILLFIGRISKIKGVDILISTFDLLKREHENLKLLIVGEVQDDFNLSQYKNIGNDISISRPQNDIENFYYLADIFVLPARMDPFPFTMLEAALAEIPMVASNVGGIPEFIAHNQNGLLFNIKKQKELLQAIKQLLTNRELRKMLISNNKKKVEKYLDKKTYFNNLVSIYKSIL